MKRKKEIGDRNSKMQKTEWIYGPDCGKQIKERYGSKERSPLLYEVQAESDGAVKGRKPAFMG